MGSLNGNAVIRLSKSCLSASEKEAVLTVLDREYLGMGEEVRLFEAELAKYFSRPVVCVANGTAALQLALQACGVGPGDEVLVQSLTYVASYQAISATGATPVSCEIDPQTLTIDLGDAKKRLSERTKVIMPVHYAGGAGCLTDIYTFARLHGLRVIEDAAHAFGSIFNQQKIGAQGDIVCFSFDGIKNITAGEGGCIVSNDEKLLSSIRDARLLGVQKDSDKRFNGERSWEFDVTEQGWRYHMSNIMAAIGRVQLSRFSEFASKRQELAKLYDVNLKNVHEVIIFKKDYNQIVPHIYPIWINPQIYDRDSVRKALLDIGIETGVHYQPNHHLSLYQSEDCQLPVTDKMHRGLISLPLHPDLTEDQIVKVCTSLKQALESSL